MCERFLSVLIVCVHKYKCTAGCILFRVKAVKCTDSRVRAMTGILSGIKVLKMYAWENVFKKLIFNIRRSVSKVLKFEGVIVITLCNLFLLACAGRKLSISPFQRSLGPSMMVSTWCS